jgi:hypothetical protein
MTQRTRFKAVVYVVLIIIAVSLLVWWNGYNSAKSRDYQRLADLEILQSQLTYYFYDFNTYQIPECQIDSLVNYCNGSGDRVVDLRRIVDPINRGMYQYTVNSLLDSDYIISFALETKVAGVVPGAYVLTKKGISK